MSRPEKGKFLRSAGRGDALADGVLNYCNRISDAMYSVPTKGW